MYQIKIDIKNDLAIILKVMNESTMELYCTFKIFFYTTSSLQIDLSDRENVREKKLYWQYRFWTFWSIEFIWSPSYKHNKISKDRRWSIVSFPGNLARERYKY